MKWGERPDSNRYLPGSHPGALPLSYALHRNFAARRDQTGPGPDSKEPLTKSSWIALARKRLSFKRHRAGRIRRYEAKRCRAGDRPFLVPTLRAPSWRAVCGVALLAKGSTLGFTATSCSPSRQDSARPRGLGQRLLNRIPLRDGTRRHARKFGKVRRVQRTNMPGLQVPHQRR